MKFIEESSIKSCDKEIKHIHLNRTNKKKLRFIPYWFVWNGWSNRHGRNAKCCAHCRYIGEEQCTEGICDYCKLHDIQVRPDLVCDDHKWKEGSKSIWDD